MDDLPFVAPVYRRDLKIENYFIGYLKHPYVSFYTGRGCRSKCTFCLWPQTVGGHRYRVRSAENVLAEVRWIKENMPEVKEIMFDDDTFTDTSNLPRVEAIARGMGELGMTWSCNAKANVPYKTLKVMKDNGLRLLLVGYESGDDQILLNIKKGLRTDIARRFTEDCRKLGILIHGTFILGLPGETTGNDREDHRTSPRRSIRTPSRYRWPRPIPGPRCTSRRWRTAGCRRTMPSIWSTTRACSWRRSAIRTCRRKRYSTAWKCSISASISGPSKDLGNRRGDARRAGT